MCAPPAINFLTKRISHLTPQKTIISSSFGKDSTAMIHLMREKNEPISHVIYFDTGWDFPQMERHIRKVERNTGIKTVRIRNYRHFDELLMRYGWPHGSGGWCAASKRDNCKKIFRALKGTTECIGFTTDEIHRAERPTVNNKKWTVRFPLIEYGFSEKNCLEYCYSLGYDWDGLYRVFDRVSCFCCPKAGKKRIDKLERHYPELYKRYLELDQMATIRN